MATDTKASKPSGADQNSAKNDEADSSNTPTYASSDLRITKDCLYMILALWMEDFVKITPQLDKVLKTLDEDRKKLYNNVGAVLVSADDVVLAVDCSREGVHAVARLLMKYYDKAEGSKIFMSRKPCPLCTKLLVQSKVKQVLYLPLKPEYYRDCLPETDSDPNAREEIETSNERQQNEVDNLFTASAIAQTRYALRIEKPVVDEKKEKTPVNFVQEVDQLKRDFTKYFHFLNDSVWIRSIKDKLPWPAFDNELENQVRNYFNDAMDWMARVQVQVQAKEESSRRGWNYKFKLSEDSQPSNSDFNPETNSDHKTQARHFMAMARFLAQRTDDPTAGVGAVLVSYPKMEIIAFGWNGFPMKAQYGEFGRASDKDDHALDKKYPYVIHAEQNALLMRNTKNIKDSILFVTKSPCQECAPLIAMEGISTVVKDDDVKLSNAKKWKVLDYTVFLKMVKDGKFVCYQTEKCETDSKGIEPTEKAARELDLKVDSEKPVD